MPLWWPRPESHRDFLEHFLSGGHGQNLSKFLLESVEKLENDFNLVVKASIYLIISLVEFITP